VNYDHAMRGGLPEAPTGAPDLHGRVYLTGSRRGIIHGAPTGHRPTRRRVTRRV